MDQNKKGFRTWKSGKQWLYSASTLGVLALGTGGIVLATQNVGTVTASAATTSSASYSIQGKVGPFTILNSSTMVGTGTSTTGFLANPNEVDRTAPTMVSGSGSVSGEGTYSSSSLVADGKSYTANWGSASSLPTTKGYVVTGLKVGSSFSKE